MQCFSGAGLMISMKKSRLASATPHSPMQPNTFSSWPIQWIAQASGFLDLEYDTSTLGSPTPWSRKMYRSLAPAWSKRNFLSLLVLYRFRGRSSPSSEGILAKASFKRSFNDAYYLDFLLAPKWHLLLGVFYGWST